MSGHSRSLLGKALEFAVGCVAVVWLLNLAWNLSRPLLPVLLVGLTAWLGLRWWFDRRRW